MGNCRSCFKTTSTKRDAIGDLIRQADFTQPPWNQLPPHTIEIVLIQHLIPSGSRLLRSSPNSTSGQLAFVDANPRRVNREHMFYYFTFTSRATTKNLIVDNTREHVISVNSQGSIEITAVTPQTPIGNDEYYFKVDTLAQNSNRIFPFRMDLPPAVNGHNVTYARPTYEPILGSTEFTYNIEVIGTV